MRIIPAIYLEPDDPPASDAEREAARIVVSDAVLAILRKTGRVATVAPVIVRTGPKLPDVPMAGSNTTSATAEAARLFLAVAGAFPEADTDAVLCFVRGIESDGAGLGASRGGYVTNGTPGIGMLGWANMIAALGDKRDGARRIIYGVTVCRALHELGHVMGLLHPTVTAWGQSQTLDTVMGYAFGAFCEGGTRDGRPVNPMLFTPREMAVIEAHPLFRDAPQEWRPAAGMTGIYGSDLAPIISGRVLAGYALVLGRFVEDYA